MTALILSTDEYRHVTTTKLTFASIIILIHVMLAPQQNGGGPVRFMITNDEILYSVVTFIRLCRVIRVF